MAVGVVVFAIVVTPAASGETLVGTLEVGGDSHLTPQRDCSMVLLIVRALE